MDKFFRKVWLYFGSDYRIFQVGESCENLYSSVPQGKVKSIVGKEDGSFDILVCGDKNETLKSIVVKPSAFIGEEILHIG